MASEQSKFFVYSIRRLPAGVWGESYALVTAFESATNEFTTEFFVITKRPSEALNSGNIKIIASPIPPELGKIDLEFTLQEGLQQTELLLMEMLETRAGELSRPDVAYSQFELKPIDTGYLLGCWMRGQFNSQLTEIQAKTRCAPLARYLGLFSQVGIITRSG